MIGTNWPQLPLNAREALRKAQLRGVASLTGEERAVLDTVPAGDLVTTRCRTCRTPVTPGHTGHDGPLVDGEETFWCEACCPCCASCGREVSLGHGAHDALVDGVETFWCPDCAEEHCPCNQPTKEQP